MSPTRFEDALADLAAPAAYVPRPDMERARQVLETALAAGGRPALLTGEPGSGKTLLLRRLAALPLPGVRAVYVPFLHLGAGEFAPWLLFLMDEDVPEDPAAGERRLIDLAWAEAAQGRRIWLLIDEAPSLPRATAARLARLMERCNGGLALALAATSRGAVREVLDCFGGASAWADLSASDDAEVTRSYVQALVSRAAPEEQERARRAAALMGPLAERPPRDVKAELLLRWRELASALPAAEAPAEVADPLEPPEDLTPLQTPTADEHAPLPPPEELVRAIQEAEAELDLAESAPDLLEAPPPVEPEPPTPSPAAAEPPASQPAIRRRRPPRTEKRPTPRASAPERVSRRRVAPLFGALVVVGLLAFGIRHWAGAPSVPPPSVAAPAAAGVEATAPGSAPPVEGKPPASPDAAAGDAGPAAPAKLAVNVNAAPWARIRVDGRELGVTPLGGVPLDPGAHRFRATFPDGRVVVRTVEISPSNRFVVFR